MQAADIGPSETVVEIGPGLGVLTERLVEKARRVIAVEIDSEMCAYLRSKLTFTENVDVIEADALQFEPPLAGRQYGVIGNLPYNIGTAVLRHLLESERPPRWLVVMLQKEVAAAVVAPPGEMSIVSIGVQVFAAGRWLFEVAPDAFYPRPRVRSGVIRLDVRPEALVPVEDQGRFFEVVRAGFSAPRKKVRNSLAQGLDLPPLVVSRALERARIEPTLRPGGLTIDDWLRLTRALEV